MGSLMEVLRLLFSPRLRLVLLGFAVVLVATQGTAWSPFLYAVF
ncbi:DUF5989 family protein [Tistrella mobilis]